MYVSFPLEHHPTHGFVSSQAGEILKKFSNEKLGKMGQPARSNLIYLNVSPREKK